jgi:hypothetical protein
LKIDLFENLYEACIRRKKYGILYLKLSANYYNPDTKVKQFEQIYSLKYQVDTPDPKV